MTRYDQIQIMEKIVETSVEIAQLKAQLSAYVRAARMGRSVVVCDRETPVARLVPYTEAGEPLSVREPMHAWGTTHMPDPLGQPLDSLDALLDERQSSR
jgi:prevent-host-death family protein